MYKRQPPGRDGKVNPGILAAAKVAGVDQIYKAGGAQAVAALAYGTESIPQVDKIVGPGNAFVAVSYTHLVDLGYYGAGRLYYVPDFEFCRFVGRR